MQKSSQAAWLVEPMRAAACNSSRASILLGDQVQNSISVVRCGRGVVISCSLVELGRPRPTLQSLLVRVLDGGPQT